MSSSEESLGGMLIAVVFVLVVITILLYILYIASVVLASAGAVAGAVVSIKNFFLSLWRVYKARLATI